LMPPLLLGILPDQVVWTMIVWCLVETPVAAVIGASVYKEA